MAQVEMQLYVCNYTHSMAGMQYTKVANIIGKSKDDVRRLIEALHQNVIIMSIHKTCDVHGMGDDLCMSVATANVERCNSLQNLTKEANGTANRQDVTSKYQDIWDNLPNINHILNPYLRG